MLLIRVDLELIVMDFAALDKGGFRTHMDGFCSSW